MKAAPPFSGAAGADPACRVESPPLQPATNHTAAISRARTTTGRNRVRAIPDERTEQFTGFPWRTCSQTALPLRHEFVALCRT